jgi:hypothetical protein
MSSEHLYLNLARESFSLNKSSDLEEIKKARDNLNNFNQNVLTSSSNIVNESDLTVLDNVCDLITQTRNTLVDTLKKYNNMYDKKELYEDVVKTLHATNANVRKTMDEALSNMNRLYSDEKEDEGHNKWIEEFKEYIDSITYSLEIASSVVAEKRNKLEDDMQSFSTIVKRIGKAYGVFKKTTRGCPICLTRDVNMFCDPCGHCFCDKCVRGTFCYICRSDIKRISPLYFC